MREVQLQVRGRAVCLLLLTLALACLLLLHAGASFALPRALRQGSTRRRSLEILSERIPFTLASSDHQEELAIGSIEYDDGTRGRALLQRSRRRSSCASATLSLARNSSRQILLAAPLRNMIPVQHSHEQHAVAVISKRDFSFCWYVCTFE